VQLFNPASDSIQWFGASDGKKPLRLKPAFLTWHKFQQRLFKRVCKTLTGESSMSAVVHRRPFMAIGFGASLPKELNLSQVDAPCFQLVDEGAIPSTFSDRLHGLFLLLLLKESLLDHCRGLVAREHD
jgi:hypothetical protein